MSELIPAAPGDFADDFAEAVELGERCQEARMVTVKQMVQLFNLLIKKSNVKKRLDRNDNDTRTLQQQVAELQAWRSAHETKVAERTTHVDEYLEKLRKNAAEFQEAQRCKWAETDIMISRHSSRLDDIKDTLKANQTERDDIRLSVFKLDEKTTLAKTKLEILLNERFDRLRDTIDQTAK